MFAIGAAQETLKPTEYKVITGHIGTGEFETELNNTVPERWRLQAAGHMLNGMSLRFWHVSLERG